MSTNYHTPIPLGAAVNVAAVNGPIAGIDAQLTAQAATLLGIESEIADARAGKASLIASIEAPIDTPVKAATPSGAGDTGAVGEMRWDTGYLYVCVDTDTWKRVTLENW